METMTQPKLTGYRQLTAKDAELMNEGKRLAEQVGAYVEKLRTLHASTADRGPVETGQPTVDPRWIAIGQTQLQQGFMALARAVAQPTTF